MASFSGKRLALWIWSSRLAWAPPPFDQSARRFSASHDRAALKPGSDVPGTVVNHLSWDFDRTGNDMGACFRPQSSLGLEDRGEILIIVTGSGRARGSPGLSTFSTLFFRSG
jgi:hypothetical protein